MIIILVITNNINAICFVSIQANKKKRREILFKSIIWRQRISKNSLSRQKTTIAYLEMEISVKNIFSVVFRYCISFKMIFVNNINIYLRLLFREKQN